MKTYRSLVLEFLAACVVTGAKAPGTFVNLDFESANLPAIPAGQFGSNVSSSNAIPGWTSFLGTSEVAQVLQNNLTLGNASIDILGPNWTVIGPVGGIIEGQYTVVLQPGLFGINQNVSASISQVGLVPANALSLQFKAAISTPFSVSLGGNNLALVPLGTGVNYTLYGANIPLSDAGQTEALTITALAGPNNPDYFDSFVFSPTIVPEPSTFVLGALGAFLLVFRCWRKSEL